MAWHRSASRQLFQAVAVLCLVQMPLPVEAQPAPADPNPRAIQPLDAETFVRLAHSSAVIQARAAELAATREAQPEVKAFAQRMVEFRQDQIPRLEAAARDNKVSVPSLPTVEHRLIFENLEPLDYLALTRRYAEFQLQALQQEMQIYEGALGAEPWVKSFAVGLSPALARLLEEARAMREKVGP
jgi:putative membrane protein